MLALEQSSIDAFWRFVEKTDTCWLWHGQMNNKGYGRFAVIRNYKRSRYLAHKVAWLLTGHIVGIGEVLRHSCDTPRCVNPAHLSTGTQKQNAEDSLSRGRWPIGSQRTQSKLTEADIPQIRQLRLDGHSYQYIGQRFRVDASTIHYVIAGRTWTHV